MCITMSRRTTLVLWLGCLAACLAVCAEGVQISHQSVRCTTTLSATPLLRRSWNLELRGGDDDEEGGAEAEAEGGAKGEEEEEDEDAGPMTINKALKQVLYFSRIHLGLARGVKEVMQALERGEAQLVVLAEDCDEENYVQVLEALTAEKGVYLLKVPERDQLGEWSGLVKLDEDGKPRRICGTSSVAVKDFGEQSEGLAFLLDYIKQMSAGEGGAPKAEAEAE
mmetsp:Transcript_24359/g.57877  ORF Transcript_24359/g.57877 Transcript_24359/m.57877 type:complete len:224 (-) Transcript_24359:162-833(-)